MWVFVVSPSLIDQSKKTSKGSRWLETTGQTLEGRDLESLEGPGYYPLTARVCAVHGQFNGNIVMSLAHLYFSKAWSSSWNVVELSEIAPNFVKTGLGPGNLPFELGLFKLMHRSGSGDRVFAARGDPSCAQHAC